MKYAGAEEITLIFRQSYRKVRNKKVGRFLDLTWKKMCLLAVSCLLIFNSFGTFKEKNHVISQRRKFLRKERLKLQSSKLLCGCRFIFAVAFLLASS